MYKRQDYYWDSDGIVSYVIDKIIITSGSDGDNISSDNDSDRSRNADREEELARPLLNVRHLLHFEVLEIKIIFYSNNIFQCQFLYNT